MVALAHLPAARALVPGLGVFTGPVGVALLLAGASLAAARARPRPLPLPPAWALFTLAALAASAVGLHYARAVEPSGDEIDYLLMAQSVWREGDLDLRDNFARGDHLEYLGGFDRMPGGTRRADGRPYPTHSAGLSVLLAPAYALGGRPACVVLLALLAAGLSLLVRDLARRSGADEASALVAWAATAGPPVLYYTAFLYTEVPAAFAIALALRLLLFSPGPRAAAAAALALSALPWLHVRLTLVAAALGAFALLRLRGRARLAFLVTAAAMAAAYAGYQHSVFGTLSPFARYAGAMPIAMERRTPLRTLVGLFVDGAYGLLPYAPVFLLALAGLPLLFGRGRRDRWAVRPARPRRPAARAGLEELVRLLAPGPLHRPPRPAARDRGGPPRVGRPGSRPLALGARGGRGGARGLDVRGAAGHAHGGGPGRTARSLRIAARRHLPRPLPPVPELPRGLRRPTLGASGERGAGGGGLGGGARPPPAARPRRAHARPRGRLVPRPRPADPALPRRLGRGRPLGPAGRAARPTTARYRFVMRSVPPM